MTAGTIATYIGEAQAIGDVIMGQVAVLDPAASLEVGAIAGIVDLSAQMAVKALQAWSTASGLPITNENILALLPESTPLSEPDPPETA